MGKEALACSFCLPAAILCSPGQNISVGTVMLVVSTVLFNKQRRVGSKSNFRLRFWGNRQRVDAKHSVLLCQFGPHETTKDWITSERGRLKNSAPLCLSPHLPCFLIQAALESLGSQYPSSVSMVYCVTLGGVRGPWGK